MNTPAIVWDLAALVVLLVFVGRGASKGLLYSLVRFAGFLIALTAARLAGPLLADFLYDAVVRDAIELSLNRALDGLLESGAAATEVAAAIPAGISRLLQGDLLEIVIQALLPEDGSFIQSLVDGALREPVLAVINTLLFLLIFSAALFLTRWLAHFFIGVNKVPVVGVVNALLGGVLGLFEAALVLLVGVALLRLVILLSGGFDWLSTEVLESTYILQVFYRLLP